MDTPLRLEQPLPAQLEAIEQIERMGGKAWPSEAREGSYFASLTLKGPEFTDDQIDLLNPFVDSGIRGLTLMKTTMSDKGVAGLLAKFPDLKDVTVYDMPVGDDGIVSLSRFSSVEHLNLSGTQVTSRSMIHIARQSQLEALFLSNTRVDDEGLRCLEKLTRLRHLNLSKTKITSAGLECVGKIESLEVLLIHQTAVDDGGMKWLTSLPLLHTLRIDGTTISNEGMAQLSGLLNLRDINLENTNVGAFGLKAIQNLPKLEELHWKGSKISDVEAKKFMLYLPAHKEKYKAFREQYERGELNLE